MTAVATPAAARAACPDTPPATPPLPALALSQAFHLDEAAQPLEETPHVAPPAPLAPAPVPRSSTEPLTADLRRLHVTVSKRFMEKLEAARDALSHSHPGADVEAILEAGLDLLIERAAKRKGLVKRPRPAPVPTAAVEGANPRYVPAAVRR